MLLVGGSTWDSPAPYSTRSLNLTAQCFLQNLNKVSSLNLPLTPIFSLFSTLVLFHVALHDMQSLLSLGSRVQ